jgi:hypothetical protein
MVAAQDFLHAAFAVGHAGYIQAFCGEVFGQQFGEEVVIID